MSRPLEQAQRPVVNGLYAHVAPSTRAETPEKHEHPPDAVFIAEAEMRALEALNAKLQREVVRAEEAQQKSAVEAQGALAERDSLRDRERQLRQDAAHARRDAARASADAERADAEARRWSSIVDEAREAVAAARDAETKARRDAERFKAQLDQAFRELADLEAARAHADRNCQAAQARLADLEAAAAVIPPVLQDEGISVDSSALEARIVAAETAAARAQATVDRLRRAQKRDATELAQLRARVAAIVDAPSRSDVESSPEGLRRRATECRHQERMAHRRSEQLLHQLRVEREKSAQAEALVDRLKVQLDRAVKATKHERERCNRLKQRPRVDDEDDDVDHVEHNTVVLPRRRRRRPVASTSTQNPESLSAPATARSSASYDTKKHATTTAAIDRAVAHISPPKHRDDDDNDDDDIPLAFRDSFEHDPGGGFPPHDDDEETSEEGD